MKRIVSIAAFVFGLYLLLSSASVFLKDSNHMGSIFYGVEDRVFYQLDEIEADEKNSWRIESIRNSIKSIFKEGRNGFDLLWSALGKIIFSGLLFICLSIYIYPSKENANA